MKLVIELTDDSAVVSQTSAPTIDSAATASANGALSGGAAPEAAALAAPALPATPADAFSAGEAEQGGAGGGAMVVTADTAMDGGAAPTYPGPKRK
jgi:hypothetical protein